MTIVLKTRYHTSGSALEKKESKIGSLKLRVEAPIWHVTVFITGSFFCDSYHSPKLFDDISIPGNRNEMNCNKQAQLLQKYLVSSHCYDAAQFNKKLS